MEVGSQALPHLIEVLRSDASDEEMAAYTLETLFNLTTVDEEDEGLCLVYSYSYPAIECENNKPFFGVNSTCCALDNAAPTFPYSSSREVFSDGFVCILNFSLDVFTTKNFFKASSL